MLTKLISSFVLIAAATATAQSKDKHTKYPHAPPQKKKVSGDILVNIK